MWQYPERDNVIQGDSDVSRPITNVKSTQPRNPAIIKQLSGGLQMPRNLSMIQLEQQAQDDQITRHLAEVQLLRNQRQSVRSAYSGTTSQPGTQTCEFVYDPTQEGYVVDLDVPSRHPQLYLDSISSNPQHAVSGGAHTENHGRNSHQWQ